MGLLRYQMGGGSRLDTQQKLKRKLEEVDSLPQSRCTLDVNLTPYAKLHAWAKSMLRVQVGGMYGTQSPTSLGQTGR